VRIESQKIITTLSEMLKLGNSLRKRGTNYIRKVCLFPILNLVMELLKLFTTGRNFLKNVVRKLI
jgi:hypothetical protein